MSVKTPDPLDVLVGARIRILRTRRGMSQSDLAGKIGVSFQQVQKYEKGANRVGASRLSRIAEILGIPIGELFGASRDKSADSQSLLRPLVGRNAVRFLRAFSRITDPRVRHSIARLVEAIADPRLTMKSSIVRPAVVKQFVPGLVGTSDVPLDPYQRWLHGQNLLFKYDAESWQRGIAIFRDGIRENPTFSPYYSSLVQIRNSEYFIHPGCFRDIGKANAMLDLAKRAVQFDPADSRAHLCCGWSYAMAHREAEAAPQWTLHVS